IIHREVKSSNILLDGNLAAMILDFGLSKIGPINHTAYNVSVSVKGTFSSLDPEYFWMLAVDEQLEEEDCSLARWAQKCVKERKFDQTVDSTITGTITPKCLRGFAKIANRCLIRDFKKRPSLTQVVAKLQDLLELQEKCDNSAFHQAHQGGTGLPKSNEKHMNQGSLVNRDGSDIGKKPHQHGELVGGDIKIFTYDELVRARRNFKNYTHSGVGVGI
nr:receptor-like protein kinase FERONIA [Tanacetum cinerariifolium]